MPSPLTKKCRGLYTATNRYDVPEGALVRANNILITRDGVIQPRYGLVPYSTTLVSGNLSHWHRSLVFGSNLWLAGRDTSANTYKIGYADIPFTTLSVFATGEDPPDTGALFTSSTQLPYYDVEMFLNRGNLYANWHRGMIRYESTTSSRRAGGFPCAVSCFPRPLNGSRSGGASPYTFTTSFPHGYVPGVLVTFSGGGASGEYAVATVTSAFAFTYADPGNTSAGATTCTASNLVGTSGFMAANDRVAYRALLTEYDSAGNEYVGEVSGRAIVTNGTPYIGTAADKNVQLAILFPAAALAANTKLELYRSAKAASAEPNDQLSLVYTKYLKADEISQGYAWITDIAPDVVAGKALYINEDQEGEKQNNLRPAACKTVGKWGERVVQGNTFDHPAVEMQLISTSATNGGLAAGDVLNFSTSTSDLTLTARASSANFTSSWQFSVFTGGTPSVDLKHTVLSLLDSLHWSGSNSLAIGPMGTYLGFYLQVVLGGPVRFAITRITPDQYEATSSNVKIRTVLASYTGVTTRGCFSPKLAQINSISDCDRASNVVTIVTTANHNFEVGEHVTLYSSWANQTVQTDSNSVQITGQITSIPSATSVTISNTGADLSNITATGTLATTYRPLFQPNHVVNRIKVSKPGQPEAFPAENTLDIGAVGAKVLKVVSCKDSLLVFKEDGLFRVTATGVSGEVLSAELLDSTAILWAKDTAVGLNDKVVAWLTKGVAIINEQGVEKYISNQRIDNKLAPATSILAEAQLQNLPYSRRAVAYADEQNGLYELRVNLDSGPSAPYASTVNLTYNIFNDTWVEDDLAVVSEAFYNGKRYIVQGTSLYAQNDQVYAGSISSVIASGTLSSTARVYSGTYTGTAPTAGTVFVAAGSGYRYYVLTAGGGALTFYDVGNVGATQVAVDIAAADWDVYSPVISTVEWAPITLVEENKLKQFAEAQVLFGLRQNAVVELSTSTELVPTAETLTCKLNLLTNAGINSFLPDNLRITVPQQHRVAQQLSIKAVIRTAYGPWTILGLGISGRVIGPRVNR